MKYNYNPLRGFKKIKQINNLRIFLDESVAVTQYKIATPANKILEEFCFVADAEKFCKETKDFIRKKQTSM
ncbi:MAG: hypothetical protein Q8O88_03920 [bacterium]|nr:hypothetical protein [bacterium]